MYTYIYLSFLSFHHAHFEFLWSLLDLSSLFSQFLLHAVQVILIIVILTQVIQGGQTHLKLYWKGVMYTPKLTYIGGWGRWKQAYSQLNSTTHAHITDCKLDSVVYAGVCVWVNMDLSCLGRTIYALTYIGQYLLKLTWTMCFYKDTWSQSLQAETKNREKKFLGVTF